MNKKNPGWKNEPTRHALSAKGVPTSAHLACEGGKIMSESFGKLKKLASRGVVEDNVAGGKVYTLWFDSIDEAFEEIFEEGLDYKNKEFYKSYKDGFLTKELIDGEIKKEEWFIEQDIYKVVAIPEGEEYPRYNGFKIDAKLIKEGEVVRDDELIVITDEDLIGSVSMGVNEIYMDFYGLTYGDGSRWTFRE